VEEYLAGQKDRSGDEMNIVCELGSSEAVKEAIIAGLGVSFISVHAVKRELAQGMLREVPVRGCVIERDIHVIHKRRFPFMKHHRLFLDFVENYGVRDNNGA